jgi:bifunctional non-homologous end joining protein LigD
MLWRSSTSRGRPKSAPSGFIPPARPTVSTKPPKGDGWVHEVKHDGYRLQIHVREGRCRLYTMNAANWTERYPLATMAAARLKVLSAIIDAELVCTDEQGIAQFDVLHSRCHDHQAIACAFDLLMLDGDDLRRRPLSERKAALRKVIARAHDGIQFVNHVAGDGAEMYDVACKHGLEGIVCKAAHGALQKRSDEIVGEGQEQGRAGVPQGERRHVLGVVALPKTGDKSCVRVTRL